MDYKEYWEKYIAEHPLDIFDDTCELFSKELPREFIEEYGVEEIIVETAAKLADNKKFKDLWEFRELIFNHQPELFKKCYTFLDKVLIEFYCFRKDWKRVEELFQNFINDPFNDYDYYVQVFNLILFCQHDELLVSAVNQNLEAVQNFDGLISGAEKELVLLSVYGHLEAAYRNVEMRPTPEELIGRFIEKNFDIKEEYFSILISSLFEENQESEAVRERFYEDRWKVIPQLEALFLKFMNKRGFSFPLAYRIWDRLIDFFEENNSEDDVITDHYFSNDLVRFTDFVTDLDGGFLISNTPEMAAILWGSAHFFDFAYETGFITEDTYKIFKVISRKVRAKVIVLKINTLWNMNFVHQWEKANYVSEEEFKAEEKLFSKVIELKQGTFSKLRSEINGEILELGELGEEVLETAKRLKKQEQSMPDIFSDLFSLPQESEDWQGEPSPQPIRTEPKVGRNDPCPCGSGKKYKKCCGK